MSTKVYQQLASLVTARENCVKSGNDVWFDKHGEAIETIVNNYMPSGSGFDSGTKIDLDKSTGDKLVFTTSYHHMNDGGYYDGWSDHTVTVKPSLLHGFTLNIGGRDRNGFKDYAYDVFQIALYADCK
jgi:hypothetical protein